jgi:CheY-like chemotaxis protein
LYAAESHVQPLNVVDPSRPPRVLVVEDNAVNLRLARTILEKLGCRVDTAENGAEGVQMHADGRYDAVFMDCQMPVMDGFEATARIRAADPEQKLPIIAVTANVLPDDQERCYASGMDDIITKPLRPSDFSKALSRWCGYEKPQPA